MKNENNQTGKAVEKRPLRGRKDPRWHAKHRAVRKERGRASSYECVDCGGKAHDWSQRHDVSGDSPSHFDPRCVSCHRKYDMTDDMIEKNRTSHRKWENGKCRWGHEMTEGNMYFRPSGGGARCRACIKNFNDARKEGITLKEYMEEINAQ